jgi:predicted nicotinamide N-methyase
LELGSGTGIVGIAAATFGPKTVLLTDLPEYLTILQANQQRNLHLAHDPACLQVQQLSWDNPSDLAAITHIDTLIGSELAYDKENVIRLMNTVRYYRQANPQLKVMIAYQKYPQEWKNL